MQTAAPGTVHHLLAHDAQPNRNHCTPECQSWTLQCSATAACQATRHTECQGQTNTDGDIGRMIPPTYLAPNRQLLPVLCKERRNNHHITPQAKGTHIWCSAMWSQVLLLVPTCRAYPVHSQLHNPLRTGCVHPSWQLLHALHDFSCCCSC